MLASFVEGKFPCCFGGVFEKQGFSTLGDELIGFGSACERAYTHLAADGDFCLAASVHDS